MKELYSFLQVTRPRKLESLKLRKLYEKVVQNLSAKFIKSDTINRRLCKMVIWDQSFLTKTDMIDETTMLTFFEFAIIFIKILILNHDLIATSLQSSFADKERYARWRRG